MNNEKIKTLLFIFCITILPNMFLISAFSQIESFFIILPILGILNGIVAIILALKSDLNVIKHIKKIFILIIPEIVITIGGIWIFLEWGIVVTAICAILSSVYLCMSVDRIIEKITLIIINPFNNFFVILFMIVFGIALGMDDRVVI